MDKKTAPQSKKTPVTKNKSSSKSVVKKRIPSEEQIAVRAYFISEQRQREGGEGNHLTDWMEAERQLRESSGL